MNVHKLIVFANSKAPEEARSLTMLGVRQAYTNLSVVIAAAQEIRQIREKGAPAYAATLKEEDVAVCFKASTLLNAVINGAECDGQSTLEALCKTFRKTVDCYLNPHIADMESTLREMKKNAKPAMEKFDFLIECARRNPDDIRILYESYYHDVTKALSSSDCVDLKAYGDFRTAFIEASKEESYASIKAFIKRVGFPQEIQQSTFGVVELELDKNRHVRIAHVLEKFTYDLEALLRPPTAQIIRLPTSRAL